MVVLLSETSFANPVSVCKVAVFDIFMQVERSIEDSHGGLGIGLALVRKLVEMHGGNVEAHSPGPNQGSEFVVQLPAARRAPGLHESERRPPRGGMMYNQMMRFLAAGCPRVGSPLALTGCSREYE